MDVNNTFGPIDLSISGLRAQNRQIKIISSNVANAQSTDMGDGKPYRRLEAVFGTDEGLSGVELTEVAEDTSEFPMILKPGHPQANKDGYVAMPNVNLPTEMISLNIAARTYQANVAVLKRYQKMVESTLELLR